MKNNNELNFKFHAGNRYSASKINIHTYNVIYLIFKLLCYIFMYNIIAS